MSEEQNVETNDGTWSGLKKTIVGAISTAILAGGTWVSTTLFGGHDEAPAPAPAAAPVININNTQQQQQASGGTNTIIKEKTTVVEKAAPAKEEKPAKKSETEDAPW
jgi:hypothetical protein